MKMKVTLIAFVVASSMFAVLFSCANQLDERPLSVKPAEVLTQDDPIVDTPLVDEGPELDDSEPVEKTTSKLEILYFGSKFCTGCVAQKKILGDMIFDESKVLIIYDYSIDDHKPVFDQYDVSVFPTFVFVRDGKILGKSGFSSRDTLLGVIARFSE
jgi:hypothetical protein